MPGHQNWSLPTLFCLSLYSINLPRAYFLYEDQRRGSVGLVIWTGRPQRFPEQRTSWRAVFEKNGFGVKEKNSCPPDAFQALPPVCLVMLYFLLPCGLFPSPASCPPPSSTSAQSGTSKATLRFTNTRQRLCCRCTFNLRENQQGAWSPQSSASKVRETRTCVVVVFVRGLVAVRGCCPLPVLWWCCWEPISLLLAALCPCPPSFSSPTGPRCCVDPTLLPWTRPAPSPTLFGPRSARLEDACFGGSPMDDHVPPPHVLALRHLSPSSRTWTECRMAFSRRRYCALALTLAFEG